MLTLLLLGQAGTSCGQGTAADYERAAGLSRRFANRVDRLRLDPHWSRTGSTMWYVIDTGPGTREFVGVDIEQGRRRPLFDHRALAAALEQQGIVVPSADRLPLERLRCDEGLRTAWFEAAGKSWRCDLATMELLAADDAELAETETLALRQRGVPRASRASDRETELRFVNKTSGRVRLFWLDPSGAQREYGTLSPREQHRQHTFVGHVWLVVDADDRPLGRVEAPAEPATVEIGGVRRDRREPENPLPPEEEAPPPRRGPGVSPDGGWRAYVEAHDIWIAPLSGGEPTRLTSDGSADEFYEGPLLWSPDSRWLAARRTVAGEQHPVRLVESSPADQVQPRLVEFDYLKPGDRLPRPRPVLFDVPARTMRVIDNELFQQPWSLNDLRWHDASLLTFVYNQRGHQALRVIGVEPESGTPRAIVDERSDTFIDYAHKQFCHWLPQSGELIWMSERSGWNHLYLVDIASGEVKRAITQGEWVVRRVARVDEERREVWFEASGLDGDQDPYHVHYCHVGLDGGELVRMTRGDGTHSVSFSPDGRHFLDTWSRVDLAPVVELRRSDDGGLVCELERADTRRLVEQGWRAPERFVAKGRDGTTDIHGVIYRPTEFDRQRRYPVIEQIYAGPHAAHVPKAFRPFFGNPQELAELGFIVVQIDGMGTSHRSKAFHDVCWRNLGDAGFPDRIAWLKAAAAAHPELDLTRVGIYGGSAGGQNALRALLAHGDFYHAAAADCGCHDNRMDKIWWNELWMGWPIGPHYAEQSNVTQAHRLQGKLLLTVGELDRNVDPASTMQVVNALIRADKDFELVIVPGAGHGAGESPYGRRRRADFFVRSLWSVEPRRP